MEEKRKYFRLKEGDSISYTIIPNYKSERMITIDLSVGGIRFITEHFVSPDSVIKLELTLERAKRVVNAIAQVRWIRSIYDDERYEIGVEFIDIEREDSQFLNQYLVERQ